MGKMDEEQDGQQEHFFEATGFCFMKDRYIVAKTDRQKFAILEILS